MSGRSFFDTTILIYSVSSEEPRAAIVERLLADGGYISVQVLNEPPAPLSVKTHEAALAIAARYGYQIYDALILAAALHADCDTLYSEDMQDGQTIKGLTIRNPFLVG
jgi:predicted nucleic acid-binding protein